MSNGGLNVYDLSGARIQSIATDGMANNVDLRYGFALGGGAHDVVATSGDGFLRFYKVDPATGQLENVTSGTIQPPVPHGGKIDGVCLYQSPVSHDTFAFVTAPAGQMQQLKLKEDPANPGRITTELVRGGQPAEWDVSLASGSPIENCVADDELQTLYVSEQHVAIWKYGAEPSASTTTRRRSTRPPRPGTSPPTSRAWPSSHRPGHRLPDGVVPGAVTPSRSTAGGGQRVRPPVPGRRRDGDGRLRQTDGIEAVATNLGPNFPAGLFVCQDFKNFDATDTLVNQNFKLVPLGAVVDLTIPAGTTTTTTAPGTVTTTAPASTTIDHPISRAHIGHPGYWMVGADGKVFAFGEASPLGDAPVAPGVEAVDLEPTPSGDGYWVVDSAGSVFAMGDARWLGNADVGVWWRGRRSRACRPPRAGTATGSSPPGAGCWRSVTPAFGDLSALTLNGPVLDSIPTPSGRGYYMVASDGGIFSFGDAGFTARWANPPQRPGAVPGARQRRDRLLAGGRRRRHLRLRGRLPGFHGRHRLNQPVTGMVRFGDGYLMVAEDGGIFNFSNRAFLGSLGDHPPARPIVAVAVKPA